MLSDSQILSGHIAVSRQMITQEQLQRALEKYTSLKPDIPLAEFLHQQEFINSEQYQTLVLLLKTTQDAAPSLPELPPPPSPIGMIVGGTRILELIGRGSMGFVYKGHHVGLNRPVAVKMLSSASKDSTLTKRLLLEARAIAKLEHPNIVQVYDVGCHQGYFFFIMQLLSGESLAKRLKRERVSLDDALKIVLDVSNGLLAAHEKGVIHRDLKPDNIMLTEEGKAKITDFGLAQDPENREEQPGLVVGTPYYMSPEQWLGHKADERSDLYSLGVILYILTTGSRPFTGSSFQELMAQHLKKEPVPPQTKNPDISDGLNAVIRKLMAKSASKRYANAGALLKDLEYYRHGQDPEALSEFGMYVRCTFCETFNLYREKKCSVCGEALVPKEATLDLAVRADEFKCDGCAAIVRADAKFCPACKRPMCVRCRKHTASLQGYCSHCVSQMDTPPPRRRPPRPRRRPRG